MKLFNKKIQKPIGLYILRGWIIRLYESIFIDWKIILIAFSVAMFNFFMFAPNNLTLKFPSSEIQINIIETLLRTVSIFLGVIFSFIVLSFNILNKYFGRFVFNVLFKNRGIKFLFSLFVITLIFLVYSLAYLKEIKQESIYGNSLFTLSIISSIIIVFSIFPVVNKLLKDSQNRKNITDLISKLNGGYEDVEFVMSTHSNLQVTTSPLIMLIEIGTISIKDYDYTTVEILISGIENNFKNIVNTESTIDLKRVYRESNQILKKLFPIASKERNENALNKIIYARFGIEKHSIENIDKVKLYDFQNKYQGWDFNNDMQDFFNRVNQFNEDGVCKEIIDSYRDFLTEIIKNYLPGRFDYKQDDWQTYSNESSMITLLLGDVSKFVSMAFSSKKYYLYQNISNLFGTVELSTLGSTNTKMAKVFLLNVINNCKYDSFENYLINSGTAQIEMLNYPFATLSTNQAITEIKCDIPFHYFLKSIDLLFAHNKLNSMVINSLKAEAMFLITNLSANDINKKLLLILLKEFEMLGSYIKDNHSDYKKDVYIKLNKYLGYIKNELTEKEVNDADITNAFEKTKNSFINWGVFYSELKEKGYVSNDRIF